MLQRIRAFLIVILFALGGCVVGPPLEVVPSVDLDRYVGLWYEIARYPVFFQEGCTNTTAEYALRDDGRIAVVNTCHDGSPEGPVRRIEGTARIADPTTNAKLKVQFFWPFEGDYWIIDLDEAYTWVVVGEPTRRYLWILSRTPTMDETLYRQITDELPAKGYDPTKLIQSQNNPSIE